MVFETIASTSLATPAIHRFYRSALATDKGIEEGHVGSAGDRNVPWTGLGPMDFKRLQRISEDQQDVGGSVREHVAGVPIPLGPEMRFLGTSLMCRLPSEWMRPRISALG